MAETQSNIYLKTPERRNSNMSEVSFSLDEISTGLNRVQGYIDGTSSDLIHNVMAQEFVKAKVMSEEGLL